MPNIAPAGTSAALTINEDTPRTLTAEDFGFSDSDGNSLLAVQITTLPTAGTLTLNGAAVTAGDTIPVASLPQLVFTPALNANGTGYASLTFQVQDNGGTADGGVDIDQSPNTITVNVTPVNDAPTVAITPGGGAFARVGTEILVNTATTNAQSTPQITSLSNGGFVVTWTDSSVGIGGTGGDASGPAVKAQVFTANGTPVGIEILVNTATANSQSGQQITALANGGFVIAWTDNSQGVGGATGDTSLNAVKAQVFAANGTPIGTEIRVNTAAGNDQTTPDITALSNGGFVVTWQDLSGVGGDSSSVAVKAQLFAAGGTPVGGEFLVNTATLGNQLRQQITALSDGGFVVTWGDGSTGVGGAGGDTSGGAIKAQVYTAAGVRVGTEILVNTAVQGEQDIPQITALSGGGFVVTWRDQSQGIGGTSGDASGSAVKAQVFTAGGAPVGIELLVNSATFGAQEETQITALSNGGFVVTWRDGSMGSGGATGDFSQTAVKAQVFSASGSPVGGEILVNTQTSSIQSVPIVTALANGTFAIAWGDLSGNGDTNNGGLKVQIFGADGGRLGVETLVNTATLGAQNFAQIVALQNGGFAVTWQDASGGVGGATGDGSQTAIKLQIFGPQAGYVVTEQTAISLKGGKTISDVDAGAAVVTATLSMDYGILTVTAGNSGATVVSGSGTGSVVVSGTVAQLNALLSNLSTSTLTFTPNTDAPPASATFTILVNDNGNSGEGGPLTASASETITITPVNDLAVVTAGGGSAAFVEGISPAISAPVAVAPALLLSDGDNPTLASATVSITTAFIAAEDQLTFTNTDAALFGNIVGSYNMATGILTLVSAGGVATLAQFQAALRATTYTNLSEDPTPANRLLRFVVNDGASDSVAVTRVVTVSGRNDAPSGTDQTLTLNEDQVRTLSASDFGFSDIDFDAFSGVRFSAAPSGGTLFFDADGAGAGAPVAISTFPSITYTAADLTAGRVTFVPTNNLNGTSAAAINFTVVDNGGTTGGGQNVDQTPNILTFNITSINDAPSGADQIVTISEDGSYVFTAADFGFTDSDSNMFSAVRITTLPTAGTLTLNGTAVTAGDTIPVASLPQLVFTPALNANGTGYASLTFQVQDNGGTADGGVDIDQSPNTLTFDVTALDDAPVLTATGVNPVFVENGSPVDIYNSVSASTIEAGQVFTGFTMTVSNVFSPANERLTFDGATFTLQDGSGANPTVNGLNIGVTLTGTTATVSFSGASLTAAQLQTIIDQMTYQQFGDAPVDGDRVFTITQLIDSGSSVAPNANTTMLALSSTVNVNPVNDAPTFTGLPLNFQLTSNATLPLDFSTVTVTDPDSIVTTTISASQGGTLAAAGGAGITIGGSGATLTLTGTAAALTSYFDTVANITYTPALNFSGNGNAFTFGVSDGALSNSVGIGSVVVAPISLTTPGLALAQNFDALASTGTTNQLTLAGWSLNESGASSTNNELYSGGTGTSATGDVYSFGATAGDRALGTLLSGTLAPTFGVAFTNNTGGTITALQIAFTGEQWRIGNISAGRAADRLDFQLSTNATSLTNGAWTDYNSLDFSSPVITGGATGSLDGNAAANRTSFNLPVTNIAIAPGGTFWLRWVDFDVTGADDGLAIDNFSIIAFTNTAAVLDLNGADAGSDNSASYIEQAPIVTLASGLSLIDADNATLTGATVRITSGFVPLAGDGADYLGINGSGAGTISGINYSYSALTGILTLSGTASVAAYEAVLAQVSFQSTTNNPGTSRTVTWTVNDGTVDSAPVTTTISVTPVDDAPMAVGDSATVDENATVIINVTGNDTDVDGGPLAVTQVNGIAATVGTAITLASGALLTLRADGGFDFDPNGRFNSLIDGATAAATGATNTEAFLNFTYTLTGGQTALVSVRIGGVASAGDQLGGSGGNDVITGTAGNDSFNLGLFPGGNDNVSGNGGDDAFFFGATLNALDTVDGGSGNDQVGIVGNYTGANRLVLGATTLTNVEVLALLPGAGTGYDIVSNDANVAAGQRMTIFAGNLAAGQNFTFDGSAETDGSFLTYGGLGVDTVTGGALDDGFYFGPSKWQAGDTVTGGGGGNDQLALDGDYTITIGANADVETLALLGGPVSTPNTFNITLDDGWVGAGTSRIVWGGQVTTALTINGAGETNGNLTFFGGLAGDTLTGGAGDDSIWGAAGNDSITGGLGSDTANFSGLRADYSVVTNMGNVQIIDTNVADGDDGTDMVVGIEFARFADQTISITSPIILDLDGDGVETLSAAQSNARFDMDGDGIGDETSWFGRGEGLLFLDRDGNGTLSNAGEMSFTNDVANARSDLEGLAAWDSNGDGQLSKKDARFASFKIWRDRDGDGVVDAGEVMSLKKAGVRSLSLSGTNTNATTALGDVAIVNTGSFTRTSGRRGGLVDAVLTAVSSKDASDRAAQHSGVSGQVPVTAATAVDQALTLAPTDDPFAALMRSDGGDLGSLNRSLFTGSFAGAVAQLQPVLSEQRVMPVATDPLAERDAGDRALATANPLTTIDDYGNWMKPDSAPGLDQRVLLMAQDMASFGATGNGASESDRWRREGSAAAEMFAA